SAGAPAFALGPRRHFRGMRTLLVDQNRLYARLSAFPGPLIEGRGQAGEQPFGVAWWASAFAQAAGKDVLGRAYERDRSPRGPPIMQVLALPHPLHAVAGQRPFVGDRELSVGHGRLDFLHFPKKPFVAKAARCDLSCASA